MNRIVNKDAAHYVPQDGHTIIIGQQGSSAEWHYFDDTPKGREEALKWLEVNPSLKRAFRVQFSATEELELVPPLPARLVVKSRPKAAFLD